MQLRQINQEHIVMRKTLLLFILLLTFAGNTTAQIHIDKNRIKSYTPTHEHSSVQTKETALKTAFSADTETVARAYGIRVYDDQQGATQQFVSFSIDNTEDIKLEKDLSQYYIRAATEVDGFYYMINSRDALCAYDLLSMDLETLTIDTIASYDISDYASAIIFLDMTYDNVNHTMYGIGYDLETAIGQEEDEEIDVELALLKIDLETGKVTSVGSQGFCNIITLAADAEGYLWGLDSDGNLWDINKNTGIPTEAYGYTTDIPTSLQSMTFNPADNNLYWTGFKITTVGLNEIGNGFLSRFRFTEDEIIYEKLSAIHENAEIIGLYIDPEPTPDNAPDAVTALTVTPAAEGATQAMLSWVNPTTLVNGNALEGNFTINIYRNGVVINSLTNQTAGKQVDYTDDKVERGLHEYMIACANANGEGKPAYVKNVYIGRDVPGEVRNLTATKKSGENTVTLTWEKPLSGKNNGWYDQSSLTYSVIRYPDNITITQSTTATTITDTDFTTLKGYTYEVVPSTGDGKGVSKKSNTVVVGPALSVPYSCDFSTDDEVAMWSVLDGDNDGHEWYPASYSSTGQTFMKFAPDTKYNPETPADDWLITPPLQLKAGVTYAIEYEMLLLGSLFPADYDVTVGKEATASAQSSVIASIDSLEINMSFTPQRNIFKADEDGEYYFGFHIRNAVMVQITDVVIRELEAVNLGISHVNYKNIGNVNNEHSFFITVKNEGADDVESYIVKLTDENGNILCRTTGNAPLIKSQEKTQHILQWTPQETGTFTLYAEVEHEGDTILANNRSEAIIMEVLEEGEWAHIQPNNAIMNHSPFVPSYKYSQVETIYYDNEIRFGECKIKGLIYYTYVFNNLDVKNFEATIALANTTLYELNGGNTDEYVQVYSGTIKPTSNATSIYIPFDQEFDYKGGNLQIKTRHSGPGNDQNLMFYGSRDDSDMKRMRYYLSNDVPYTDKQTLTYDDEISNVSFLMTETNAADKIETTPTVRAYISHGNLFVTDRYDTLNIYSIDGRLCATYNTSMLYIPMSGYAQGIYLVEVVKDGTHAVSKVVLNR